GASRTAVSIISRDLPAIGSIIMQQQTQTACRDRTPFSFANGIDILIFLIFHRHAIFLNGQHIAAGESSSFPAEGGLWLIDLAAKFRAAQFGGCWSNRLTGAVTAQDRPVRAVGGRQ